jgi:hypothetical protein
MTPRRYDSFVGEAMQIVQTLHFSDLCSRAMPSIARPALMSVLVGGRREVVRCAVGMLLLAACSGSAGRQGAAPSAAPNPPNPSVTEVAPDLGLPPIAVTPAVTPGVAPTVAPTMAPAADVTPDDHQPGWTTLENRRAGSTDWKITQQSTVGFIEGYARTTSARRGDQVPLYVSTLAPTFTVRAYRMGWYGGAEGRLVWTSDSTHGRWQLPAAPDHVTGLVEAHWAPTVTVPVGADWLPGAYLLKLVSSQGDASYVPITIRDDTASAQMTFVDAVATWQAYNTWGGCSLYKCYVHGAPKRAVKVSFDRPYIRSWHSGSADFLDHELALISLAEQGGLDLAYVTSLDVQDDPSVLAAHHAVLSPGHDEYYSRTMRDAVLHARDQGVNLAFFGANAIYRHVRFEPASDATPERVEVDYREQYDPILATNPAEDTTQWRVQGLPEAAVVGIQYACADVHADLVVAGSSSWVWHGAGVENGQHLPDMLGTEADTMVPQSPHNVDLLSASPITCRGHHETGRTSYYSAPSGAGVFASGTIWWVCALDAVYCSRPGNIHAVQTATRNVLAVFAQGPAGGSHPSGRAS